MATPLLFAIALAATAQSGSTAGTEKLANSYLTKYESKLEFDNKLVVKNVVALMDKARTAGPKQFDETVDDLVTAVTAKAVKMESPTTLLVLTSKMALAAPNQRTYNLFAAILNATDKPKEVLVPLQAAMSMPRQFPKGDFTLDLNLAAAYMDNKELPKAKAILDKVLKQDPKNRRAWRTYAAYWYEKKDGGRVYDCLLKAAEFKGFIKRKIEKRLLDVIDNEVQPNDPPATAEQKLAQLDKVVPITSAEVVEEVAPEVAAEIRRKRLTFQPGETASLPELPTKYINTTSLREFSERTPALIAWVQAFGERYQAYMLGRPEYADVVNAGDDAARERAAKQAGDKELRKSLQEAKQRLEQMKAMNVGGGKNSAIDQALQEINKQAAKLGINLKAADPSTAGTPPDWDYGSRFVRQNFANYVVIRQSYESWLNRFFLLEYPAKEAGIIQPYTQKLVAMLDSQNKKEEAHTNGNSHVVENITLKNGEVISDCRECIKLHMEHRKSRNDLAETYWKQWAGLYFPAYAQKMKPMLERYWKTSMLYIRNMKQKDVMEREYNRVQSNFHNFASKAGTGMGIGATFAYTPITPEEEEIFQAAQQTFQTEGETDVQPQALKQFDVPKDDWVKWIGDNLYFEAGASIPLVAHFKLKITPTTVEIEPYVLGTLGNLKLDMMNMKLDATLGNAVKLWMPGIKMLGLEGEAQVDLVRKQVSLGIEDGTYSESYTKPQVGLQLKNSVVTAKLKMDTELKPKLEVKMTAPKMQGVTFAGSAKDVLKLMN